jgi:hypothetical protein
MKSYIASIQHPSLQCKHVAITAQASGQENPPR